MEDWDIGILNEQDLAITVTGTISKRSCQVACIVGMRFSTTTTIIILPAKDRNTQWLRLGQPAVVGLPSLRNRMWAILPLLNGHLNEPKVPPFRVKRPAFHPPAFLLPTVPTATRRGRMTNQSLYRIAVWMHGILGAIFFSKALTKARDTYPGPF